MPNVFLARGMKAKKKENSRKVEFKITDEVQTKGILFTRLYNLLLASPLTQPESNSGSVELEEVCDRASRVASD